VQSQLVAHPKQRRPGRPRAGTPPDRTEWQLAATIGVDEAAVTRAVQHKAAFLVATNILDPGQLGDRELIQTYKEQHSVERGFSFLKDPLFLASSVFVKKPSRIVALSLVMVLCLLVYRLAEHRLRVQLTATGQTVPNQLKQATLAGPDGDQVAWDAAAAQLRAAEDDLNLRSTLNLSALHLEGASIAEAHLEGATL
jgi:transposase